MKIDASIYRQPADGKEAVQMQRQLHEKLSIADGFGALRSVLGVDVGYNMRTGMSRASIVHMELEGFAVRQALVAETPTSFPYISGLLAFREIPAILEALRQLDEIPDLLMIDGQGIAHPRRMGIAAHLGVLLDMPSIGVGKSRLCGDYEEPGDAKGAQSALWHKGEHIGTVLRSREKCRPLFVSPGHRISVASATEIVLKCLTRYRLPEPTRLADKYSKTPK